MEVGSKVFRYPEARKAFAAKISLHPSSFPTKGRRCVWRVPICRNYQLFEKWAGVHGDYENAILPRRRATNVCKEVAREWLRGHAQFCSHVVEYPQFAYFALKKGNQLPGCHNQVGILKSFEDFAVDDIPSLVHYVHLYDVMVRWRRGKHYRLLPR